MKNLLLTLSVVAISYNAVSQTNTTTPTPAPATQPPAPKNAEEFDSKFRLGLRINPQPTWLISSDKNNIPTGTGFGFGFGLNLEYRFSNIAALLTGLGADFENGKYTPRLDKTTGYEVQYWMDEVYEFIPPANSITQAKYVYTLKERRIRTTHVTIPIILKLSTKEYGGIKYFGMFGGELGIRVKARADDTYSAIHRYTTDSTFINVNEDLSQSDINIKQEAGRLPLRIGFNAGAGLEYRLGGSTSLFFSVNYFRALTNMMREESDLLYYRTDGKNYRMVNHENLAFSAIRLNIGLMF